MIKIILFDFGSVLGSDTDILAVDKEIAEKTGLTNESLQNIFNEYWPKLKVGAINLKDYYKAIVNKSTHPITVADLEKLHYEKIYIDNSVLNLVKELKKKGHRIMILSNESLEGMSDKKKKFQLDQIFEKIYNSAEIGLAKPDNRIFEYVIKDLNNASEDILFIDDWDINIDAAKKSGMQAIQFSTVGELEKNLLM